MKSLLAAATQELHDVWPALVEIERVDVDESGEVMLTANDGNVTRWFTHDDRGLIERFPERDKKLPLAERLRESSGWRVLSYRPGRRMVVVVCRGDQVSVVKGHKKGRSSRAAVSQGVAEQAMRAGAFRVPRLLQHDVSNEALVFEHLAVREVGLAAASAAHYERLGQRLAVFQGDHSANDLKVFSPRDELDVLERWRSKVLTALGGLPVGWEEARARLHACSARLPAPELGLCHRDLHDRQVHVVGDELTLLDFDLLCRADVALDAGNLVAHLRWRALQGLHEADESSAGALAAGFLEGLGRAREPGFQERLAFYTASALLRLALVYRIRPPWGELVPELVSRAGRFLDDLDHGR